MDTKLAEHRALMRYVEAQTRLIIQVFIASIIVSLALIGYGFQIYDKAPYIFLSPIAIFMVCAYLLISLREETFKWMTYILVFLEDGEDLRYETALARFRIKQHPTWYRFTESVTPIYMTYWALLIISVSLFVWAAYRVWHPCWCSWYFWILMSLVLLLFYLHRRYFRISVQKTKDYSRYWKDIKEHWAEEKEEFEKWLTSAGK